MEDYEVEQLLMMRAKQFRFCVRCGRHFKEKGEGRCMPLCRVCGRNYRLNIIRLKDVVEAEVSAFKHKEYMKTIRS
jgi:NMD protein affecting ribosome stability and mRNA decay